jgi:hypothetical protein
MNGFIFRGCQIAITVACVLCLVDAAFSQARLASVQEKKSVLVRSHESTSRSQTNDPSQIPIVEPKTHSSPRNASSTINQFNPLELMDATPIGSAAIPQAADVPVSQATNSTQTQNFGTRSKGTFTVARLTDQPNSSDKPEVEFNEPANSNVPKKVENLNGTNFFSVAHLEAKVTGPVQLSANQYGNYNVSIQNLSAVSAMDTELFLDLPTGSRVKSDKRFQPLQTENGILFNLGTIKSNQPIEVPFQMSIPQTGNVQVVAYLRHSGSTQLSIDVQQDRQQLPSFEVAGTNQAKVNATLTYALIVHNPAPSNGTFVVRAVLPRGLSLTVLDRAANYNPQTGTAVWTIQNLAGGKTETIQFKARALRPGNQMIVAEAYLDNKQIGSQQLTTSVQQ